MTVKVSEQTVLSFSEIFVTCEEATGLKTPGGFKNSEQDL